MRKYLMAVVILLGTLGMATVATAQPNPAAIARIEAILAQFPDGGPGLRAAIARAAEAQPSLAEAMVAVAVRATLAQQQAIGAGLGDAASFFARLGTAWAIAAQQTIQAAMANAPPTVLASFTVVITPNLSLTFNVAPSGITITASRCISRSGPGGQILANIRANAPQGAGRFVDLECIPQ